MFLVTDIPPFSLTPTSGFPFVVPDLSLASPFPYLVSPFLNKHFKNLYCSLSPDPDISLGMVGQIQCHLTGYITFRVHFKHILLNLEYSLLSFHAWKMMVSSKRGLKGGTFSFGLREPKKSCFQTLGSV